MKAAANQASPRTRPPASTQVPPADPRQHHDQLQGAWSPAVPGGYRHPCSHQAGVRHCQGSSTAGGLHPAWWLLHCRGQSQLHPEASSAVQVLSRGQWPQRTERSCALCSLKTAPGWSDMVTNGLNQPVSAWEKSCNNFQLHTSIYSQVINSRKMLTDP